MNSCGEMLPNIEQYGEKIQYKKASSTDFKDGFLRKVLNYLMRSKYDKYEETFPS